MTTLWFNQTDSSPNERNAISHAAATMSVSVAHIDERLDELERLRDDVTPEVFLTAVADALCDVLRARNVLWVHPLDDRSFVTIAVARDPETAIDRQWIATHLASVHRNLVNGEPGPSDSDRRPARWIGLTPDVSLKLAKSKATGLKTTGSEAFDREPANRTVPQDGLFRFACSLAPADWRSGGLVISCSPSTDLALEHTVRGVVEAFAEISYLHYLETFARDQRSRSRELIVAQDELWETTDPAQSAVVLVNALSSLLPADRVCLLCSATPDHPRLLAVSGADDFDRRTEEVKRIERAATETSKTRRPRLFRQSQSSPNGEDASADPRDDSPDDASDDASGILGYCIPWDERHVVLMQWMSETHLAAAAPWLNQSCHSLKSTWRQTLAWHQVPSLMRGYWKRPARPSATKPITKVLFALAVLGAIVVVAMWPVAFTLSGVGKLEPIEQSWVFAAEDGFVRQLHVTSGQQVRAGDKIATLESTDLQIQITDVSGRIREIETQRAGIEVAINQIVRSSTPDPAMENRLQSELKELAIRLDSLNEQAALLDARRQALHLVSPIDGTIVGWEIERNLLGRPVRRGDVLMRVADKQAPWRVELMVPDRDIGYLESFAAEIDPQSVVAEYALRARPQMKYRSELRWVSEEVVLDASQGAAVETHLSVDQNALPHTSLGATVDGRLLCGTRPRWFVWGRPILEAIQRRFWF